VIRISRPSLIGTTAACVIIARSAQNPSLIREARPTYFIDNCEVSLKLGLFFCNKSKTWVICALSHPPNPSPPPRPVIKGGEEVAHEAVFVYCEWATTKSMW
jgi:hypothetical protein